MEGRVESEPTIGYGKILSCDHASAFYASIFRWTIRTHDDGSIAFDDRIGQGSGLWGAGEPAVSGGDFEVDLIVDDLDGNRLGLYGHRTERRNG